MEKMIEIIVPCFNEEECIELFYQKIGDVFQNLADLRYSIFFVDDGSRDGTLEKIKKLAKIDPDRIHYISFSRNFGKESAMYVGLSKSTGDYVVVMDADLQHPPELLSEMYNCIEAGYDCVTARRVSRKGEPKIRSFFSEAYYHVLNKITSIDFVPGGTDYRMMTRQVADAVVSLPERERFTKGIYSWVGFKNKWLEYENVERVAGTTKWSFKGLVNYASSSFISFATTPLRGVIYFGMLVVLLAFIYAVYVFVAAVRDPGARTGYASILLAVLFLGGVIITILGMIGEYLARIYLEVKGRPIYIIKETNLK